MADGQQKLPGGSNTQASSLNGSGPSQQQYGGNSATHNSAKISTEEERARKTEKNRRKRQRKQLKKLEQAAAEGRTPQAPLLNEGGGTTDGTAVPAASGCIRKPMAPPSHLPERPPNQTQNPKQVPSQPPKQSGNQIQSKRPNLGPVLTTTPKPATVPCPPAGFPKFKDMPNELQMRVFEIAYRLCEEEEYTHQNNWACISRKVKEWIEPLIYESIILPHEFQPGSQSRLNLYERTFRSRPELFYKQNVKRIFTNNSIHGGSDFELELLSLCDNLISLECWSNSREELQTLLRTKTWPRLETLSIDLDLLPQDENIFNLPLFQNITYLDFCTQKSQLPSWESLASLQKLTHIRVCMLAETQREDFRDAMDQAYAVASEARKYFPPNLKHFVILVPFDILYKIASLERKKAKDKQRWERMESIRVGKFDSRIILGCSGNWETWLDGGDLSDVEEDQIDRVTTYAQLMAIVTYQRWPRDQLSRASDDEPIDTWKEVEEKDQKRMRLLNSRKE